MIHDFSIAQPAAPDFILNPASVILASAGQTVILECSATGEPLPTITWKFGGANLNTSSNQVYHTKFNEINHF